MVEQLPGSKAAATKQPGKQRTAAKASRKTSAGGQEIEIEITL